ncbi:GL17754 [Drosophila persimilis]|uniref:GL17754 n=1 Tax=Drosophila persimilis TaxID=7234 RepID=B4GIP3_DROPE|nr:GL17754 [Drosophila persimilis]
MEGETAPNESSPSLNVLCGICNEFYRANDIIFSTASCGHVFHRECLTRWLGRSPTCPQCRATCHRNRIHRIYLNFAERTELDDQEPPKQPVQWVPMDLDINSSRDASNAPEGAIQCGTDEDGLPTYVARGYFNDDLLPASYAPQKKAAFGSWSCRSYRLIEGVEVLVLTDCDHEWVPGSSGSYPPNALPTGYSEIGEVTYTGLGVTKVSRDWEKVHPSHKVMYIPHRGQEVNTSSYEVLVVTPRVEVESPSPS